MPIPGAGTDLFRAFLDKEGIEPVRANDLWVGDDLIVIVIGSTVPVNWNQPLAVARQAIASNGAVLARFFTDTLTESYDESGKNPDRNQAASPSIQRELGHRRPGRDLRTSPNYTSPTLIRRTLYRSRRTSACTTVRSPAACGPCSAG